MSRADYWAMEYRTLKGKPYRFNGEKPHQQRAFLQQMLADDSKHKTYQKSRQCGVSENSVSEILYLTDKYDYKKFMYVFPTGKQMKDFVQTRIEPAILSSEHITSRLNRKRDNLNSKQIGKCDIFFRSGSTPGAGEGVDLDGVFFDERDRMVTSILDAFREGLSSSPLALIRDISTPSLPGTGVNLSFEQSDKKYWFVRCTKCGHKQVLTFPESLVYIKDEATYDYKCKKCNGYRCIDRTQGEWVPEIKDTQMPWSGYQVSQLDCAWIAADDIMEKKNRMFPQFFFNYVLGLPYVGSNILIEQRHINNALEGGLEIVKKQGQIIAGVDWGDTSWIVIGMLTDNNKKVMVIHYEKMDYTDPAKHFKRVSELIDEYNIDITVCDAGYGKDRNAALFRLHPKKVFSCNYVDTYQSKIIENVWMDKRFSVTANRTVALKVMALAWKQGEVVLPKALVVNNQNTLEFFNHMKSLAVKLVEVSETEMPWERIGSMGPDHFAHAFNYMWIAFYRIIKRGYSTIDFLDLPFEQQQRQQRGMQV